MVNKFLYLPGYSVHLLHSQVKLQQGLLCHRSHRRTFVHYLFQKYTSTVHLSDMTSFCLSCSCWSLFQCEVDRLTNLELFCLASDLLLLLWWVFSEVEHRTGQLESDFGAAINRGSATFNNTPVLLTTAQFLVLKMHMSHLICPANEQS